MAADAAALASIGKLMNGEGPTCKFIILKHDGKTESKSVKMAPGWEAKFLEGPPTIIGMYKEIEAILIGAKINELKGKEKKELKKKKNQHKLPHDMHEEEEVYGDIIVFSNDLDAEPVDLHLKDWTDFLKDPTAQKYLDKLKEDEAEFEDESDLEENSDDEDEEEESEEEEEEEESEEEEEEAPAPAPAKGKRPAAKGDKGGSSKKKQK